MNTLDLWWASMSQAQQLALATVLAIGAAWAVVEFVTVADALGAVPERAEGEAQERE